MSKVANVGAKHQESALGCGVPGSSTLAEVECGVSLLGADATRGPAPQLLELTPSHLLSRRREFKVALSQNA